MVSSRPVFCCIECIAEKVLATALPHWSVKRIPGRACRDTYYGQDALGKWWIVCVQTEGYLPAASILAVICYTL